MPSVPSSMRFDSITNYMRGEIVSRLVRELYARPDAVTQCRHIHLHKPPEKLEEGWAEGPGLWFTFDGGKISGDRGRGHLYPTFLQRRRLRKAIAHWRLAIQCQHVRQSDMVWGEDGYTTQCLDCKTILYFGESG